MKKLFVILTMLAALLLTSVTAFAASSLVDNAQLLSSQQRQQVLSELQKQEKAHNVRIAVVTMPTIGNAVPGKYANALLDNVYNDGAKGNMVLLQVKDQRKWYIATDKKMKEIVVGDKGLAYISEPMLKKLKSEDYAGAYTTYAQKGGELLQYYEKEGKAWDPDAGFSFTALLAALACGAFGAYVVRSSLVSSMSNVRTEVAANAYLNRDSFELTQSNDAYLYTNVAAVPKPKRNNAGHGGISDHHGDGNHGGGGGGY